MNLREARAKVPSISPNAGILQGVVTVLRDVESFGGADRGRLCFGPHGEILVEGRRVCWAAARAMERRLTDRLRKQRNPPLTRAQLEAVFQSCRRERLPVGEALVASGLVSESGLRTALLGHTAEAIVHLGSIGALQTDFVAHPALPYDARFAFSTAEILAGVGARRDPACAAVARTVLAVVSPTADAFAFVRPTDTRGPVIVATRGCSSRRVSALLDAAECAASSVTGDVIAGTTEASDGECIAAHRDEDVVYVALRRSAEGGAEFLRTIHAALTRR